MFFQNMLIAAEQVAILYLIALVGVIADKTKVFTKKNAKQCTDLLFYVITPAKIIESFFTLECNEKTTKGLFVAMGCGVLMHGIAAIVEIPFFNKSAPEKASIYKFASIYGNCGYMGLPLIESIVGSEGIFYGSAVIITFQVFTFTHGVWLMNRGKAENKAKIDFKKIIINPGVLAVIAGLPMFLMKIDLPNVILSPIRSISSMNSPLAMLIFGTYIANTSFKSMIKHPKILGVCAFKLILMPLAMIFGLKLFGIGGALGSTLVVISSTPPANNTIMFASKYDQDVSLASQTVAFVSFLSIFTMPVMIALK